MITVHKCLVKKIEVDEEGNMIEKNIGKTKKKLAIKSDEQILLAKNKKQCMISKGEASKEFNKQLITRSNSFIDEMSNEADERIIVGTSTGQMETQEQKVMTECPELNSPWFTVKSKYLYVSFY